MHARIFVASGSIDLADKKGLDSVSSRLPFMFGVAGWSYMLGLALRRLASF